MHAALIAGIGNVVTAFRVLTVSLHYRGGLRPEDRIGVVADKRYGIAVYDSVAGILAQAPQIDDRAWTTVRRLEIKVLTGKRRV